MKLKEWGVTVLRGREYGRFRDASTISLAVRPGLLRSPKPRGGCVRDDSGPFDTWIGLDDRFAWMIMDATQV